MNLPELDFKYLRDQIVGIDSTFETPFGQRLMTYCDYTASGRNLMFVEHYLQHIQRQYANTHTEDDITGRSMTQLLHQAEQSIKDSVNAGPHGRIIACGTGSTGAIDKFQQILGVYLPPATRHMLYQMLGDHLDESTQKSFIDFLKSHQPVIFVGPYEHHSNEVTWREGLATVIEVDLAPDGNISLSHLESLLKDPAYKGRMRIGSFSAASNVTGLRSPVKAMARLLHKYGALVCMDYAASAPYVPIDMNPDPGKEGGDPSLDAIFISPHKFIGGPGSSGILVFNEKVYHKELAPTVGGGGTVGYVSPRGHDFLDDIEEREKAGTPGVLQTMKAALAFQVKDAVTPHRIEEREQALLQRVFHRWNNHPRIEILGSAGPEKRVAIVSFNLRDAWGSYLHPKFVTVLLNDLFGIQSRAGCSCAGPYGHRLLRIDNETSEKYRQCIIQGYSGIKPGWCRVGFHYTMDDAEVDYVLRAVEFIAEKGHHFLSLYDFDVKAAIWSHKTHQEHHAPFSLAEAVKSTWETCTALCPSIREKLYQAYLNEAEELARNLAHETPSQSQKLEGELGELQFFSLA